MAKEDNLIPGGHKLTLEEQSAGGKASGKARREKATMKKTLEMMLEEIGDIESGLTNKQLATLGLIKGAILGNSTNYRTILETIGELENSDETPSISINIVDNSDLEKVLYEDNN